MAEASSRGGRRGKRKIAGPEIIDVANIYPVSSAIEVQRHGNLNVRKDFASACGKRGVLVERIFDEEFLSEINFRYLQQLKDMNCWQLFIDDGQDVFTNVVKVFYFWGDDGVYGEEPDEDFEAPPNVVRRGRTSRSFRTKLLPSSVQVDEELIRRFLKDPVNGGVYELPDENSFPYLEAFREILGNPTLETTEEVKAWPMSLDNRILHLMVTQVLFPRGGEYSKVRRRDIYWMYQIIHNQPINLSGMIMTRMMEGMKNSKTGSNPNALPYGRLVSKICSKFCAIHPNEPTTDPQFKKPFNKKSIGSLGWKLDRTTGTYVRKNERGEDPEPGLDSFDALFNAITEMNNNNMNTFVARVENVEQRLSVISAQNVRLFREVKALRDGTVITDEPFPDFATTSDE